MKRSHWLLMLLCCLIPFVGIAAIVLFRIPASSVLYVALGLACPLLHLAMMGSMRHDHGSPKAGAVGPGNPTCHGDAPTHAVDRPGSQGLAPSRADARARPTP